MRKLLQLILLTWIIASGCTKESATSPVSPVIAVKSNHLIDSLSYADSVVFEVLDTSGTVVFKTVRTGFVSNTNHETDRTYINNENLWNNQDAQAFTSEAVLLYYGNVNDDDVFSFRFTTKYNGSKGNHHIGIISTQGFSNYVINPDSTRMLSFDVPTSNFHGTSPNYIDQFFGVPGRMRCTAYY